METVIVRSVNNYIRNGQDFEEEACLLTLISS